MVTFTTELKRIKKVLLAAVMPEGDMDSTRMNSDAGGGSSQNAAGVGAAGASGASPGG